MKDSQIIEIIEIWQAYIKTLKRPKGRLLERH